MNQEGIRLGAIPGATPDKWVSRWRDRYPEFDLAVHYFDDAGQLERIERGTADVGYIRFREDAPTSVLRSWASRKETEQAPSSEEVDAGGGAEDLFHRVLLYREEPVVCAAADHWIAASEESVGWEEIAGEAFLDAAAMIPGETPDPHVPLAGTDLARAERIALEVVASGAGLLILPNSVARMLSRKDIVIRRVEGLSGYDVGLCWLREKDGDVIQEFIGVARGRKPGSGRSAIAGEKVRVQQQGKPAKKAGSSGGGNGRAGSGSGRAGTKAGAKSSRGRGPSRPARGGARRRRGR